MWVSRFEELAQEHNGSLLRLVHQGACLKAGGRRLRMGFRSNRGFVLGTVRNCDGIVFHRCLL